MSNLVYQNDSYTGNPVPQTSTGNAADVNVASGAVGIDPAQNVISNQLFKLNSPNMRLPITSTALVAVAIGSGGSIRLVNEGPNACFVAVGNAAGVLAVVPGTGATLLGTVVLAGEDVTFSRDSAAGFLSAICLSNQTATLNVSIGEGA